MFNQTVSEAIAGLWQQVLWFGCPYRCLTDTTGVDISHQDNGGGSAVVERERGRERKGGRACLSSHITYQENLNTIVQYCLISVDYEGVRRGENQHYKNVMKSCCFYIIVV